MRRLLRSLTTFFRQEDGVTAIECALLLALVVIICVISLKPKQISFDPHTPPPIKIESVAS